MPYGWPLWIDDDADVVDGKAHVETSENSAPEDAARPVETTERQRKGRITRIAILCSIAAIGIAAVWVVAMNLDRGEDPSHNSALSSPSTIAATTSPTLDPEQIKKEEEEREAQRLKEEAALKQKEQEEAEEQKQREAEEAALKDPSSYKKISDRDWKLLEQDPAAHKGEKYVLYGYVTQADSNTAPAFRADTSGTKKSQWYDYEVNTIVVPSDSVDTQVATDDLVTLYVEIGEPFTYDTTIGGSMTAPSAIAHIIKVDGSI